MHKIIINSCEENNEVGVNKLTNMIQNFAEPQQMGFWIDIKILNEIWTSYSVKVYY